MRKIILAIVVLPVVLITSCSKDGLWVSHNWEKDHPYGQGSSSSPVSTGCSDTMGIVMSYSLDVAPILSTNCSLTNNLCHSSHSGRDLTSYSNVASWCSGSSPVIMSDITWQSSTPMPQDGSKLPDCTIAKIAKWIKQGYPNN